MPSTAELGSSQPSVHSASGAASWRQWLTGGRLLILLGLASLIVALISLDVPSTPSYDPWSWLLWGKQIIHGHLDTRGGPSWKPLPMIFIVPFALFGHFQPNLWLVIARAGAVMCALMCFKLAWRLTRQIGPVPAEQTELVRAVRMIIPVLAGILAAGSLINSPGFVSDNALGYSEGLAVAFMLAAFDRALDGHHKQAFVLGFVTALDRPEVWPFWGAYGLWLMWKDPSSRALVIGLAILTLALWFGPAGFSGVTRAQKPRSNSAAFASCPVCTVFKDEAWPTVLNRLKIPGVIGMVIAAGLLLYTRREWWGTGMNSITRARAWFLAIGVFGFVWWLLIGIETQAHFSGNARYLVVGVAPVGIACGIAWGWFAQGLAAGFGWAGSRVASLRPAVRPQHAVPAGLLVAVALFFAVPPWIGKNIISFQRTHHALVYQAKLREDLNTAIKEMGGPAKVKACGTVMTEGFQVPMTAWALNTKMLNVRDQPTVNYLGWDAKPHGWWRNKDGTYKLDKDGNRIQAYEPLPASDAPNVILQDRDNSNPHTALLPLPDTIIHWEKQGVDYQPAGGKIVGNGTFRLFVHCK